MAGTPRAGSTFSDLVETAGIGPKVWNRWAYSAFSYYHHIVALFTAAIVVLSLVSIGQPLLALGCLAVYVFYFLLRIKLPKKLEVEFYRPNSQFLRALVGVAAVSTLLALTANAEIAGLWLLYIPAILPSSKHCHTRHYLITLGVTWAMLVPIHLYHGYSVVDLVIEMLWLGFLSFMLHFLVQNVKARDETIEVYNAVGQLSREADMADSHSPEGQWHPLLAAVLHHLEATCVSVWMCNHKTRELHLVAMARVNTALPERIEYPDPSSEESIPLNTRSVLGVVATEGKAHHVVEPQGSNTPGACSISCQLCREGCDRLVVPINMGTDTQPFTIGVVSVGFRADPFKKRMLSQYENYLTALMNQAKPMLAYARRVDQLVAMESTSREVSHSLNLTNVLSSVLDAFVDTLGFSFGIIYRVDTSNQVISAVYQRNAPEADHGMAVSVDDQKDARAQVVRTGEILTMANWDDRLDERIWKKRCRTKMAAVFVPIAVLQDRTRAEQIVAVIEGGYHSSTATEVIQDRMRMLEWLKTRASIAVEHALLLLRLQTKVETLASLDRVGQAVAKARQPRQVLVGISRSAAELLGASIVMVYRYNREKRTLEPPAVYSDQEKPFRPNLNASNNNILTSFLDKTDPYYSSDAHSDQHFRQFAAEAEEGEKSKFTFIEKHGIRSCAAIPLIANNDTVGIMFTNYRTRHQFGPDERQVHELFAQLAAVAITNATTSEMEREWFVREQRARLSHDLHHSIIQALVGIVLKSTKMLESIPMDDQIRGEVTSILEIASTARNDIGFIIDELRSQADEYRNLRKALEAYRQRVMKWYKLNVILEIDIVETLKPRVEQEMIRVAKEAITNAFLHSACRSITVRCRSSREEFSLEICDDGRGFDPSQVQQGKLGLVSMEESTRAVGGKFVLHTTPGAGTTITVRIPAQQELSEDVC